MRSKLAIPVVAALALAAGLSLPVSAQEDAVMADAAAQPAAASAPSLAGLTDADRTALLDLLERGRAETEALVAKAEGDAFTWKPAADRWSVAEVLEHIGSTEKLLFGMLSQALAGEPDPEAPKLLEAVPVASFSDRIQDRSQKVQAPDMLVPKGGVGRDELLAAYRTAHDATIEFVRATQAPVASFTAPTPAGKLTAHHLLALIAAHNIRHNKQMAEVLEQHAAAPASTKAE